MMLRVPDKTGMLVRARAMFYKTVVQTVLLYRRSSWVIRWAMVKVMEAFNYRITRRIMGKTARSTREEFWE